MLYIIIWGNKMNKHKLSKIAGVLLLSAVMLLSASAVTANTTKTNSKDGTFSIPIQQIPKPKAIASFVDILSEGFETAWVADSSGDLAPPGWQVHKTCISGTDPFQGYWHRTGTIPFTTPGPVVPHGGSWQAFCHWSYDHQSEWLVTPILNLGPNGNLEFWFYGNYGSPNLDHYYVKLSPSGGYNQGDFTVTLWDASALPVGTNYYTTPVEISLSAYNGQSVRLAWHLDDGPSDDGLWYATVIDDVLVTSGGGGNLPPVTPAAPTGPTSGFTGVSYSFSATTTDPEGDNISYMFDWGNGNMSSWIGPYSSGGTATTSYAWASAGSYNVKVKAKDSNDAESGWSPAHAITITAGPTIEIGAITGGLFKVKAVIENNGAVAATNVSWGIDLAGGIIILGKASSGTIPTIAAGGTATITSKMIVGFGKTVITVTAGTATKTQNATVLLIFIKTP